MRSWFPSSRGTFETEQVGITLDRRYTLGHVHTWSTLRQIGAASLLGAAVRSTATAQNGSFDARRIALGGIGDTGNVASQLVAEERGYGSIVLPFGLLQVLEDTSIFDPGDDNFDPVRAAE